MFDYFNGPYPDTVMLPLNRGPWPVITIITVYLLFVLKFGRQFMANRKPFELQRAMKYYNIGQVIWNMTMSAFGIYLMCWVQVYEFRCMDVLPLDNPWKMLERITTYSYFLNKIVDLMDTIFFVLRKSYKQITVLHVFHHVVMIVATYAVIRVYGYGGHPYWMGFLNTKVHAIMYGYYYLSSRNKEVKNSLWWKKYITIIQLLQFALVFAHSVWTYNHPSCSVPISVIYLMMIMPPIMTILFANFYIHAYILKKKPKLPEKGQ